MIQFETNPQTNSMIMVVGIGGGGNNSVNYMHQQNIPGIRYMICNTDAQVLERSQVETKIQLGPNLTQGLGAGFNPKIGEEATIESKQEIINHLKQGVKMVFLTAGMGGGTGTGGAPVLAQICKELNILTVAIVTTPFAYEGQQRKKCAEEGIKKLKQFVDIIIVVNNDKIRQFFGNLRISQAFAKVDDVVGNAIKSITNITYSTGTINVDFADVCTVMKDGGIAIMGVATSNGSDRAVNVAIDALNSPLLNDTDIKGAKQILMNIISPVGEHEITPDEIEAIQKQILDQVGNDANLIFGLALDETLTDEISLTLIITGFQQQIDKNSIPEVESKTILNVHLDQTSPIDVQSNQYFAPDKQTNQNDTDPVFDILNIQKKSIPTSSTFIFNNEEKKESSPFLLDNENDSKKNILDHQEQNFSFTDDNNLSPKTNQSSRQKLFDPYTFEDQKLETNKQFFYEKDISEINFNIAKKEQEIHSHSLNSFEVAKDLKSNQISIKKSNEYTNYYEKKNPD